MCRTDGKLREKGYEVIRKYEGKITSEEAVKKIIEKHKSIQVARGGKYERL